MEHILVIKLGALGDFIQAFGPMKAIRKFHKDAHITLLTTQDFVRLAENSGYFDDIWVDERPAFHQITKWLALRSKLNSSHFNRVYDLQNNDRTGIYFKLLSPKPEWVGIAKGASHRNISPERTSGLAYYGHVQTLKLAGIKNIEIDDLDWITSDVKRFDLPENYILIIPGSAHNRPEKRWSANYYAELCHQFCKKGYHPVLIGTHSERDVIETIQNTCTYAINLCTKTNLEDLPVLARGCVFAIGNDTGPMHMIGPTGCQTFVLFSNHSKPHRHAPLGENVHILQKGNLTDLNPKEVFDFISQKISFPV